MSLSPGSRIGGFQVIGSLGAGGMGEVYRARDTRLDRDVALKILPDAFARDPDRVARFEREAKALAALNHPNIAGIHGLEAADGRHTLVLELVEGPTLADRLAQGPMTIDEFGPIASQIAEALEAAHEAGIVHRDLKPANIKLRPDGTVKVLDFGLAKALTGAPAASQPGVTQSPTITSPAGLTGAGMLLGTAAYMAPEQAKGRNADRRSDVWSFGCVLYEMLTGRRAFPGDDLAEVLAAVIKSEPDWTKLPAEVTPTLRVYLQRALAKDPHWRVQAIGDVRLAIEGVFDTPPVVASAASVPAARSARYWPAAWAIAGMAVGMALAIWVLPLLDAPTAPPPVRFRLDTTGERVSAGISGPDLAVSPDGARVVYFSSASEQRTQGVLAIHEMDQLSPTLMAGVVGQAPFVSDDGRWVGFLAPDRTLRRVAIAGGPPQTVCALAGLGIVRGAAWSQDTIIFGVSGGRGLLEVSSGGGTPVEITKPGAGESHLWPDVLPSGRVVLFTVMKGDRADTGVIVALDRRSGVQRSLIAQGRSARFVASGHLAFEAGGALRVAAFDPDRLQVTSDPVTVVEGLGVKNTGAANYAVARNGTLFYMTGTESRRTLVLVDRTGKPSPLPGLSPQNYQTVRVSPSGTHIVTDYGQPRDVWTYDLGRTTAARVTMEAADDRYPNWTPDGRVVFTSDRGGRPELFVQNADGTGTAERLFERTGGGRVQADAWSADGTKLVLADAPQDLGSVIGMFDVKTGRLEPVAPGAAIEGASAVSPDGGWLAYQSDRSGVMEVYVERFPDRSRRQKISVAGGFAPRWSPDGRELIYLAPGGRLISVPVTTKPDFTAGKEVELFSGVFLPQGPGNRPLDVLPDGKRFVLIKSNDDEEHSSRIIVVQNWTEEIRRQLRPR
jgi:serine/threonine-protein kinase